MMNTKLLAVFFAIFAAVECAFKCKELEKATTASPTDSPTECSWQECQYGYYWEFSPICQCLLACDYIMECPLGEKWDLIECSCVEIECPGIEECQVNQAFDIDCKCQCLNGPETCNGYFDQESCNCQCAINENACKENEIFDSSSCQCYQQLSTPRTNRDLREDPSCAAYGEDLFCPEDSYIEYNSITNLYCCIKYIFPPPCDFDGEKYNKTVGVYNGYGQSRCPIGEYPHILSFAEDPYFICCLSDSAPIERYVNLCIYLWDSEDAIVSEMGDPIRDNMLCKFKGSNLKVFYDTGYACCTQPFGHSALRPFGH